MQKTKIQWTDMTANPIRARRLDGKQRVPGHFCQKISPGCANCYASRMQPRFGLPQFPGTSKSPADMGVEVFLDDRVLQAMLKVRKPCRVFLCDMTDLFGDWVPFDMIDKIFAVMALTPHITYQILTKRPERMAEYLNAPGRAERIYGEFYVKTRNSRGGWAYRRELERGGTDPNHDESHPLARKNWWLGTSCEDQPRADERIPHLLRCPAAIRFLSIEPQIGPINLTRLEPGKGMDGLDALRGGWHQGDGKIYERTDAVGVESRIDWCIVGGESGHNARPFDLQWARDMRDQCRAAGVTYFLKQIGAMPIVDYYHRDDSLREWGSDGHSTVWAAAERGHFEWEPSDGQPMNGSYFARHLDDSHGGDEAEWPIDLQNCRAFPA